MTDKFYLKTIIKDGVETVKSPSRRLRLLIVTPLALSFFVIFILGVRLTENYVDTIISALSIFTGFFFTLIVYVADKASSKKRELYESQEDEIQRFLKRYLSFSEKVIIQISYSILTSICLIFLLLLSQYNFDKLFNSNDWVNYINIAINFLTTSMLFHFIVYLLLIVSNMYALFLEEVKS